MSKLSQTKKLWGYVGSVPRCSTCKHFKESQIKLTTNSQTVRTNHHCQLGGFTVAPNGVCKVWAGNTGKKLEPATESGAIEP